MQSLHAYNMSQPLAYLGVANAFIGSDLSFDQRECFVLITLDA